MSNLRSYATLAQLRARNTVAAADTTDDARMLAKLRAATTALEERTARTFQPLVEARKFDYHDTQRVMFRSQDLLTLTSLVDGYGLTIDPAAIIKLGGANDTYGPYYGLELDPAKAYMGYLTTRRRAITISGVWGWHDDYGNAWHTSADSVQDGAGINASVTTITVTSSTGADSWGQTPRFSAGQLIQIDSEWLHITATTASTLTVVRGVNGTIAATHALNAPISVYEPARIITEVTLRWAAFLMAQDDTDFGHTVITPLGDKIVPARIPPDLDELLRPLVKVRAS
ncbi:MAG: hypothetical protein ABI947_00965 [Chloroflexota bacterium]